MSKRYGFSNKALDAMIKAAVPGFTRQIPESVIEAAFPFGVNTAGYWGIGPEYARVNRHAKESDAGRGIIVFDVYHPGLPIVGVPNLLQSLLLSFKISREARNPRNAVVTSGKGERHIEGVIRAARNGTAIPMVCLNYIEEEDQWYRMDIDVAKILRDRDPETATGKHGVPLTLSVKRVQYPPRSGRYPYSYRSLRVNIAPATELGYTEGWVSVDGSPALPTELEIG